MSCGSSLDAASLCLLFLNIMTIGFLLQGCQDNSPEDITFITEALVHTPNRTAMLNTTLMPHVRSCEIAEVSSAASNLAYSDTGVEEWALDSEKAKLEKKGWRKVERYTHQDWGSDGADLWKLADNCMLVFRGSDDVMDIVNAIGTSSATFHGLDEVHVGVARELDSFLDSMEKKSAKEFISTSCASSFVVSGHSLGGALAQLLAVLVNKNHNPLGWTRKVDAVYVFGSMPLAKTRLSNEMREDGCFPGGSYVNKRWGIGHDITDFAYGFPFGAGFKQALLPTLKMDWNEGNFNKVDETPCGSEMHFNPLWTNVMLHLYHGSC